MLLALSPSPHMKPICIKAADKETAPATQKPIYEGRKMLARKKNCVCGIEIKLIRKKCGKHTKPSIEKTSRML